MIFVKRRNIVILVCIFLIFVGIVLSFFFLSKVTEYKVFAFNKKNFYLYQESNKQWFKISKNEFVKKYGDKSHTLYVGDDYKGEFNYSVINDALEMVSKGTDIINRYTKDNYFTYAGSSSIEYIGIEGAFIEKEDEKVIFNKLKEHNLEKDYNASYIKKYSLNNNDF